MRKKDNFRQKLIYFKSLHNISRDDIKTNVGVSPQAITNWIKKDMPSEPKPETRERLVAYVNKVMGYEYLTNEEIVKYYMDIKIANEAKKKQWEQQNA